MKIDLTKEKNRCEEEAARLRKRNEAEKTELRELAAQLHALKGEYRTKQERYVPHKYELMHVESLALMFAIIEEKYEPKKENGKDLVEVVIA